MPDFVTRGFDRKNIRFTKHKFTLEIGSKRVFDKEPHSGKWRIWRFLAGNPLQNPEAAIFARRLVREQTNQ